jgi:acetyl-CoA acetyltransferase
MTPLDIGVERRARITGIGMSPVGRRTGIPGPDLTMAAARQAIADAGLRPADIDAVTSVGDTPAGEAAAALGIAEAWPAGMLDAGGLLAPVMSAVDAVATGRAGHVLVYRTVQMIGGTILGAAGGAGAGPGPDADAQPAVPGWISPLLAMHAYSAANWVAMHCRRHMHLYGTTKQQLGWLAVNSRRNAALNPAAVYRQPMSLDDYLAARPISDPLGLYDCDVPVDGSVALVVSAADRAGDGPHRSVRVEAMGRVPGDGSWDQRPDYPKMASADAAAQMWSRTDLTPRDVDVAELYDGFTFLTFAWLEALGLCGEGEAGPFVDGGHRIALDGDLPLNTYGGQLSAGRLHGYGFLHEAVTQLRGAAGARQAPRAEVAVVGVGGGPIAGCMLLTA